MTQFMNGLVGLVTTWQSLVPMLLVAVLIVFGIMFIIPAKRIHEFAKASIGWVVVGVGLALCATAIASEVAGAWGF